MARIHGFALSFLLGVSTGWAQMTASLSGVVTDPSGDVVAGARAILSNSLTGFEQVTETHDDGSFALTNIPFQTYRLAVEASGFAQDRRVVSLRSNIPIYLEIHLKLAVHQEAVTVRPHETGTVIDLEATGTRTELNLSTIERMPIQIGSRGLESVLVSFPGFAQNANGAIHPRGAHNQMTYVLDGMPISDQLTGSFASSLDPNMVQTIELFTGNIPAEFGSKISGVAVLTSRTGLGTGRKFAGNTQLSAGQFNTFSNVTQLAGEKGRLGYFVSLFALNSNRYLDQVSLDNLHNRGNSERGFVRLDYQPGLKNVLRFHAMAGRSWFQLANLRSQQARGQNQKQQLRDFAAWIGWVHLLSPRATVDSTLSYRTSIAQLFPSSRDIPVTASQDRHLTTFTLANRVNAHLGAHTLRGGVDYQHFPVSEEFSFGVTDPAFNDPASERFRQTLLRHDLTRGGTIFSFAKGRSGDLYTAFGQDSIRWSRFTLGLGLRYDAYRFIVKGNQLQPRLGLALHLRETKTVLRASYNRNYQTPPNENLLLSSSEEASVLVPSRVREALGGAFIPIRPERQNVYELGLQQSLLGRFAIDASFYHKDSHDQQDNDNFLNTGIIFPTSLKKIHVNGAELRLTGPSIHGFSEQLSLTHSRAVSTPPFTGGLFLNQGAVDLLTSGPFVIDHDQKLSSHAVIRYSSKKHVWTSWSVRYDSGLVANPSNPDQVANDRDYYDLLPYVNLRSNPPRVRPRSIVDVALGYEKFHEQRRRWEMQFQVTNLTNRTALYNFQSVFVGTRVVQPRTWGVKVRWYW